MAQQTSFVIGHSVADLSIDPRGRALQGSKIIEVRHTSGVLRPGQKLLAGDDPN